MPAGLLNTGGNPKPVYNVLDNLINEQWRTRIKGKLDLTSNLQGRGFYGDYRLKITHKGQNYRAEFDLERGMDEPLTLNLKAE
jgi:hypothetical protein